MSKQPKVYRVDTNYAKEVKRIFRIYGHSDHYDPEKESYFNSSFYDILSDENGNPKLKNYQPNLVILTPTKMADNLIFFFNESISLLRYKFNPDLSSEQIQLFKSKLPFNNESGKRCEYQYKRDSAVNLKDTWHSNIHVEYEDRSGNDDIFLEGSRIEIEMSPTLKVELANCVPNLALEDLTGFIEDIIIFLAKSVTLLEDHFVERRFEKKEKIK